MSNTSMSVAEREAFLAAVHVAIFAVSNGEFGPVAVPVWYAYEPGGDVLILIGKESEKARLLRAVGRLTLSVQDERPPYGYVSVEGPVTFEPVNFADHVVGIAERYLGEAGAKQYLAPMTPERSAATEVLIRLKPERWRTVDYRKAYG